MIEDIVFQDVQYYELQMDSIGIKYPMGILFGSVNSTDIIQTERITIF
jgi:hypothetical protein